MASHSQQSFRKQMQVVVLYLDSGVVMEVDVTGTSHAMEEEVESGELLHVPRDEGSQGELEATVILGYGETSEEALQSARQYFRRIMKWDGIDCATQRLTKIFGHDVSEVQRNSQVDFFSPSEEECDSDGSSTDFSGAEEYFQERRKRAEDC